jgi:N-acetylneuraminic acid mutarotase
VATPNSGIGGARRRRRQLRLARTVVLGITFLVVVALLSSQCSGSTKHGLSTTTRTTLPRGTTSTTAAPPAGVSAALLPGRLPQKLSRASAVTLNGRLLLLGGLADTGSVASVLQIDPGNGNVQPVGSLAVATHDAAAAALGSTIYLFGGGEAVSLDTVQAYANGHASVVGHLPEPRSDGVAVTVSGRIYIVGGFNGRVVLHDVLATTDGATFLVIAHLPVAVRYPAVAVEGTTIYLIGGQTANGPTTTIQSVNVADGTAKVVAQLPQALVEATAFALGNQLFVAGGRNGSVYRGEVDRLDITTGALTPVATLPGPVADAGSATVGSTIYLAGGESPARLDQILAINASSS